MNNPNFEWQDFNGEGGDNHALGQFIDLTKFELNPKENKDNKDPKSKK